MTLAITDLSQKQFETKPRSVNGEKTIGDSEYSFYRKFVRKRQYIRTEARKPTMVVKDLHDGTLRISGAQEV